MWRAQEGNPARGVRAERPWRGRVMKLFVAALSGYG